MGKPCPLILLVEDEPPMRRFLRTTLRAHGYQVVEAGTVREGLAQAAGRNPDLILLDLGLPDGDGLGLVRPIRRSARTPIIVISARGQEHEKVSALDLGADDYLTKPFGVQELLARVRVGLRHASQSDAPEAVFESGGLRVDLERRLVFREHDEVHLTPTEYKLLTTLVRHSGKVLTHRQLLHDVWGANYEGQTHYLRVYMAQLRQKLERDSARPRVLLTEPGVGYRLATRE
ncbi:MAG TPA: response regulator [Gemmatimonadales bacterium]|nr:response regulator [Gemmatimonadales bacterium]